MTKTKAFFTVFGVLAAAGAVITSLMVKNRGKLQIEGEIKAGDKFGMPNKGVKGSAAIRADRAPQH